MTVVVPLILGQVRLCFHSAGGLFPWTSVCGWTVHLPPFCSQVCRSFLREFLERKKLPFGTISSFVLLMIIYTTFCDTFSNPNIELDPTSLLLVALISQSHCAVCVHKKIFVFLWNCTILKFRSKYAGSSLELLLAVVLNLWFFLILISSWQLQTVNTQILRLYGSDQQFPFCHCLSPAVFSIQVSFMLLTFTFSTRWDFLFFSALTSFQTSLGLSDTNWRKLSA